VTAARARAEQGQPLALAVHQFRYDLLAYSRNRQAQFFTAVMPVLFLVIFASVFGGRGRTVKAPGGTIDASVSYVPGIMTLGIIAATFVNLVIPVTAQRETGVLKRRRATPASAAVIVAGRSLLALTTALVMTALLLAIGWFAFHTHLPARTAPAFLITEIVGAFSFCCLGFAVSALVHDHESAQPVTQAIMLPLYFISGVFVPRSNLPRWLADVADGFPVRHLASALLTAYNPHTRGAGFAASDLLIVASWGAGGLVVAVRRFRWTPTSH
jgi:ABC-2 type transport system permease protein